MIEPEKGKTTQISCLSQAETGGISERPASILFFLVSSILMCQDWLATVSAVASRGFRSETALKTGTFRSGNTVRMHPVAIAFLTTLCLTIISIRCDEYFFAQTELRIASKPQVDGLIEQGATRGFELARSTKPLNLMEAFGNQSSAKYHPAVVSIVIKRENHRGGVSIVLLHQYLRRRAWFYQQWIKLELEALAYREALYHHYCNHVL